MVLTRSFGQGAVLVVAIPRHPDDRWSEHQDRRCRHRHRRRGTRAGRPEDRGEFPRGVFLLSDRVLAVGDVCNIANRVGTVEDITLRSVRLRTQDQTLVSVPAGGLAQARVENVASREKILVLREGLFLEIASSVEASGGAFAQPTKFVYVDRKAAGDHQPRAPVANGDMLLGR
jgi:hypothetical protein